MATTAAAGTPALQVGQKRAFLVRRGQQATETAAWGNKRRGLRDSGSGRLLGPPWGGPCIEPALTRVRGAVGRASDLGSNSLQNRGSRRGSVAGEPRGHPLQLPLSHGRLLARPSGYPRARARRTCAWQGGLRRSPWRWEMRARFGLAQRPSTTYGPCSMEKIGSAAVGIGTNKAVW